jgi:starch-binding outer membrane protein, SusD/RagB family
MRKYIFSILLTALAITHTGCKKFVEVPPPITEIVTSEAFKEDASATSAVLGIYINILSERSFLNSGISVYSAMAADETTDFTNNAENLQFQQNGISPTNNVIDKYLRRWPAAKYFTHSCREKAIAGRM